MNTIEMINASAGSGKTYRLTETVIDIVKSGVDPEALMATTFTKRAAAELRERIRVELLKSGHPEQANRINDGFIGTVNSICARLLMEYALDAGMSPALEVMPEEDSASIFRVSIDQVINQYADQMEPAAHRLELNGASRGYQTAADWRDHVKNVVDLARSNQLSPGQLRTSSASSWKALQAIFGEPASVNYDQALREAISLALDKLNQIGTLTKTTQATLESLKTCGKRFERNQQTWSDWIRLAKLTAARDGQEVIRPVNAIADRVLQHPQFQADVRQMIEGTFECAIGALQEYDDFKLKHGLMDFTDQETRVLELAQDNDPFKASISDRIQTLLVDEFQDTSPIQLALFVALNELAGKSIWVGDPKQAIYGFRGTDPQLMEDVIARVGTTSVLDYSWRSRENLLAFTNALFSEVFHKMGKEKVCLKVPEERAEKARGGYLETWQLAAKNAKDETAALTNGVRDLVDRIPGIKPGDIAILCRTNNRCAEIAASIENIGIRASVGQGLLLETRECQLALAALRYMNNPRDSLALAEIMQLAEAEQLAVTEQLSAVTQLSATEQSASTNQVWTEEPSASVDPIWTAEQLPEQTQTAKSWLTDLMTDPEATKEKWQNAPTVAQLNDGRSKIKHWTPLEALEQAISRIGLLRTIKAWPNPAMARGNLDAMRLACRQYIDQCASHRSAATIDGFITYMQTSIAEQALGHGEMAVNILTYHKAKGLEWPWVVLTDLDASPRASVFGVMIESAPQFDMSHPLANRKIRYWPWPFGAQKVYPQLDENVNLLPLKQTALDKAEYEDQRLLYVGMTRAKDGLVMAIRRTETNHGINLKTGWLDSLKNAAGEPVIKSYPNEADQTVQVGSTQIPFNLIEYRPESTDKPGLTIKEKEYLPSLPQTSATYPIARLSPSRLSASETDVDRTDMAEAGITGYGMAGTDMAGVGITGNGMAGTDMAEAGITGTDMSRNIRKVIHDFGNRIRIYGQPEMDALGSAVHAYLAVDCSRRTGEEREQLAQGILQRWDMAMSVEPSDVVAAGQRLDDYVKQHYPVHHKFREWPMTLHNDKGQLLQGWIDLLLETPDGYVIIDHKDYPGPNAVERVTKYIPQLKAYRSAVENATGKPVIDTLLHLPISGLILRLQEGDGGVSS